MYAEERQRATAQLAAERGRVSVAELAERFRVTMETIRRDLGILEQAGLVRRVHGGAVPAGGGEPLLSTRDAANVEQKERIARAAVELVPASATVLLDAGSTTGRFASVLPGDRPLTIFTHAVPVAARIADRATVRLHLLPGRVRTLTHAAVGADTVTAIRRLHTDLAIMGVNAISESRGLTTPDPEEAAIKTAMIAAAGRRIVLADSSKLNLVSTVSFATLADIDVLVTDTGASARDLTPLRNAGVEVIRA